MSGARTVAEGWVHRNHGIPSSYNRGCRCEKCRACHSERGHAQRRRYRSELVEIDGWMVAPVAPERHGRFSTYANRCCRCEPCVAAAAARYPHHVERSGAS